MIIFHAAWDPETARLHLWAENAGSYKGSYRRVIPAGRGTAPLHPFSLGRAALAQYAAALSGPEIFSRVLASKLILRLPSGPKGPIPASGLGVKSYTRDDKSFFKNWEVGTLALEAGDAAAFFASLSGEGKTEYGPSFIFAKEIADYSDNQTILRSGVFQSFKEKMPDMFQALAIPAGAERLRPEFLIEDFFERITDVCHPRMLLSGIREVVDSRLKSCGNDKKALVFQLDPPEESVGNWKIRFLFQPFRDRSLFVRAENIWKKKNQEWSVRFFAALREAAGLCPLLEPALKMDLPASLFWTEDQVYLFCNHYEPILRQNGFEIIFAKGKPEIALPGNFQGELRPYQRYGAAWLRFLESRNLGACLADDMGLGKTVQVIALALSTARPAFPTLVVCPMSVAGNWQREFERFASSLKTFVHHGEQRLSKKELHEQVLKSDIVITTYSLVWRDLESLEYVAWGRIVLDEAQNIKNEKSLQAVAVKKLKAGSRIALTGTPVENRLSELWSIMDFLNPGVLGTAAEFSENYAVPVEKEKDGGKADDLREKIAPFLLRRLKTDKTVIQDLPEKNEMKVFCSLTPEQAELYRKFLADNLEKIKALEGIERKGQILAVLVRLKQICNHPAQFLKDGGVLENRSGKLDRLAEMLEEAVSEGDKALVFTQFSEMGGMLEPYLAEKLKCPVLYLHGGTSMMERDRLVKNFQSGIEGPAVFILSLKAGGTGLNLTAANHVFHFDRWWNPAVENQATDRAFRIGQTRDVQVHKLISLSTLEERIDRVLEEKTDLAGQIISTGEDWITELSNTQIEEWLRLK